jgi:hypothetical protein
VKMSAVQCRNRRNEGKELEIENIDV